VFHRFRRVPAAISSPIAAPAAPNPGRGVGDVSAGREEVFGVTETEKWGEGCTDV
jgi:hypothetical protein